MHELRFVQCAAIRDNRRIVRDLERRGEHIALSDAHVVRIAKRPKIANRLALPNGIGHKPFGFAGDVNAGELPQSKHT